MTLFNIASAKVLPPSIVALGCSTSTSPHPWSVPQLLAVQSAQYMVSTCAIKSHPREELDVYSKGFLVLPQFSESGEASAASSNFLTFSLLLRSRLQLTLFLMSRSGIVLSIKTNPPCLC